jgi:hypothetical protein
VIVEKNVWITKRFFDNRYKDKALYHIRFIASNLPAIFSVMATYLKIFSQKVGVKNGNPE